MTCLGKAKRVFNLSLHQFLLTAIEREVLFSQASVCRCELVCIQYTYTLWLLSHIYTYCLFGNHNFLQIYICHFYVNNYQNVHVINYKMYTHVHLCAMNVHINKFDNIWNIHYFGAIFVLLLSHSCQPLKIYLC